MQSAKKVFSTRSTVTAVIALIIMIIAGVMFKGHVSGTGFWHGIIIANFSRSILGVSAWFGNNYGLGIIVFTLLIRLLILPLMVYQTRSMRKMQEVAPALKAIQAKYPNRDTESMAAMQAEQSALYKEAGVNPFASLLPLIVQMPILIALYTAIRTTKQLETGIFLWAQLGQHDHLFILPILAALFTFASSYLVMLGQPEKNGMTTSMTYIMPIMIFIFAINVPSALSLYWVVSNAFQVAQTWTIQNPFEIRREREAKKQAERERERAIRKAKRSHKR
ncbi:YidC/Oxa1 family membrane protein insertase [Weissella cibaria]|uniref:Membrane protein insertase YidC n=1 Tax=Weissella cibaria TaxID=137591 RepID=A0A0D1KC96_9LACO|nr:YidC/Oxa1 family membrane protein insertase [Weissella cibaria]KIU21226.1 Stage III sporulation protein J [Weissella cibaria]KIU22509.1 Stage III sporulation protein J [Weissella cibaria]MDV8929387.1 YidC/Oxa1 family membrane protein insertase [Weissella cibaria]